MKQLRLIERTAFPKSLPFFWRFMIVTFAVLLAGMSTQAQTSGLSELPATAVPPGMTLYRQATVSGEDVYVCRATDTMAWDWFLTASEAKLFDAANNQIGRYTTLVTIISPGSRRETTWENDEGTKLFAALVQSAPLAADHNRAWQRYDVKSREGSGAFSVVQSIIRISPAWFNRPTQPCDKSHAGSEVRLPYKGSDLFLKR